MTSFFFPCAHTQYFSDRFVRREINNLKVMCLYSEAGCNWEGKYEHFYHHIDMCEFATTTCSHCGERVRRAEIESHNRSCSCVPKLCPLSGLGCTEVAMADRKLHQHLEKSSSEHMKMIASHLRYLEQRMDQSTMSNATESQNFSHTRLEVDVVEADGASAGVRGHGRSGERGQTRSKTGFVGRQDTTAMSRSVGMGMEKVICAQMESMVTERMAEMKREVMKNFMRELKAKDDEITSLQTKVAKLEKTIKVKNAEHEDRDFRLSLIENSNHDGSMIWKIPQFTQRKSDAVNGKYTSIFSLPFYTGRYGFKMCLRLYIMGDGIGKGTHLSLFFVVMRGEFDNILQWPFTHKVTFKLINQAGGRHIVDSFAPDPMSSSFRKPKSDMNIASGCPRFVSHTELERGGFIVDDTIFIKCTIDTTTIRQP